MIEMKNLIVVSAPSGTGKSTLLRRLVADIPDLRLSISTTTRQPRPGEESGKHYHFVDEATFEDMIARDALVEWAKVFGNYYGTSRAALQDVLDSGQRCLLEIDVQGWLQIKNHLAQAKSVFIYPPSAQELWNRLSARGTDDYATRLRRVRTAKGELAQVESYGSFVLNEDLEKAYQDLYALVQDGAQSSEQRAQAIYVCQQMVQEWDESLFKDA
ncbi:MAG: guanylate kinase [Zetaproteobacteria bacterium]|nr:guanylate kinase [Zetaproteobacteria bacterium]